MFWIILTILIAIAVVACVLIGGFVQRLSDRDKVQAKASQPGSAEEDDYLSAKRKGDRSTSCCSTPEQRERNRSSTPMALRTPGPPHLSVITY